MSKGGGGSSNEKYVNEQYDYEVKKFHHDWQEMQDSRAYQQEGRAIQAYNQQAEIDIKNQQALNEWADQETMRIFDYNNQVDVYNASKKRYNEQLEFNDIAQELQLESNTRKYKERITDIGFQNEDLLMKLEFGQEVGELKQREVGISFAGAMGEVGLSIDQARSEAQLTGKQLIQKLGSRRKELAIKGNELQLDTLQKSGKLRNLGQAGRTAHKNIQSLLANQATAGHALTDLLTQAESQYNLDVEKVAHKVRMTEKAGKVKLKQAKGIASLGYDRIATDLLQQTKTSKFSQKQLNESLKSAGQQWEADQKGATLSKLQADWDAEGRLAQQPKMRPQLSAPLALPMPKFQEMPPAMSWERMQKLHPVKGVVQRGSSGMSTIMSGIQTALMFAKFSDDRLKYDINRVGTSPSGIPKYTFKYRFDGKHGPTYVGASAQDLIAMGRQDAVGQTEKDGFYYVDYGKLDVTMEVVTT